MFYSYIKYVDIQYYYVKETVVNGDIKLEYMSTNNIIIDGLTKVLLINKFSKFRNSIRLRLLNK